MSHHIGRFCNDAELIKARRISLTRPLGSGTDRDYDDYAFLTSVVPAMVEEIRRHRAASSAQRPSEKADDPPWSPYL